MPDVPAAANTLDREFRDLLMQLRARLVDDIRRVWPAFRLDDIDGTWPPVLTALAAIVQLRHRQAAAAAAGYLEDSQGAYGIAPDPATITIADADPDLIDRALTLAGPIGTKKSLAARRPNPAATGLVRVAGVATALTLAGARDTVATTVAADPRAAGWRRVTDSSPCDFCAAIAARGVIAQDPRTAKFEAHDHCGCTAAPVWHRRS